MKNTQTQQGNDLSLKARLTIDSKGMLARLMATEDITVEHQLGVSTAYFDTRSRRLVLPVWKEIDEKIYDMLIGHEVGHALFTPAGEEIVKKAVNRVDPKNQMVAMSYLNIVEDARIERKMKLRYPGLVHDFRHAYRRMLNENAFGLADMIKEGAVIPLIDRLNIKAKLGVHADAVVSLSPQEEVFFQRMMRAESFEDVVALAKEIYDFSKPPIVAPPKDQGKKKGNQGKPCEDGEEGEGSGKGKPSKDGKPGKPKQGKGTNQSDGTIKNPSGGKGDLDPFGDGDVARGTGGKKQQQEQAEDSSESNESGVGDEDNNEEDSSSKSSENEGKSDDSSNEESGEDSSDDGDDSSEGDQSGKGETKNEKSEETDTPNDSEDAEGSNSKAKTQDNPAPSSITASAHEELQKKMAADPKTTQGVSYFDLPAKKVFQIGKVVEPFKSMIGSFDKEFAENPNMEAYLDTLFSNFRKESKNYVQMLVKEFDLRKAADISARTKIANSGTIDCRRLHTYKFSEDIFRKVATIKAGKSHGMVMFIDWSGSMSTCLRSTIRQLLNLVMFCRQTGIPFDVYAFSDRVSDKGSGVNYSLSNYNTSKTAKTMVNLGVLRLINMLSSSMSARDLARTMKILLHVGNVNGHCSELKIPDMPSGHAVPKNFDSQCVPHDYRLNGTPLDSAIIHAMEIVPAFQKRTGVQIVNTIILTDGENCGQTISYNPYDQNNSPCGDILVVRDPITKTQFVSEAGSTKSVTAGLVKLLRERTNCNAVGFYLIETENGRNVIANLLNMNDRSKAGELDNAVSKFRNEKFIEIKSQGYNSYFVIPSIELSVALESKDVMVKSNLTAAKISNTWIAEQASKKVNRVVLGRFIETISKEATTPKDEKKSRG